MDQSQTMSKSLTARQELEAERRTRNASVYVGRNPALLKTTQWLLRTKQLTTKEELQYALIEERPFTRIFAGSIDPKTEAEKGKLFVIKESRSDTDQPKTVKEYANREHEFLQALSGNSAPNYLYHENDLLVMEALEGANFLDAAEKIVRQRELTQPYLAMKMAEALQQAHSAGITHNDIKSGNFFITEDGEVKLIDFGFSMWLGEKEVRTTDYLLGTPGYFAPEKTQHHHSQSADIFALGHIILDHCVLRNAATNQYRIDYTPKEIPEDNPRIVFTDIPLPPEHWATSVLKNMITTQRETRACIDKVVSALRKKYFQLPDADPELDKNILGFSAFKNRWHLRQFQIEKKPYPLSILERCRHRIAQVLTKKGSQ